MRNLRTKIRMIIGGGAAVGLVLYVLLGAVFKADVIDGESQVVESSLTNNGDQYSGSTIKDPVIPKYEKFELTFDINWYEGRAFTDPTQQYNPLAPEWTDADSKTGDFVLYKEKIYKCKADLPKSWRVKDKYNLDDIVRYNGKTYKDIKAGEHEAYTAVYADYTQQQNASDDNYGHYYSYPYPRPDDNEPGTTNGASYWEEIANFDAMPGVGADWNNYWLATDIKPLNSFWPYDEFPDANGVQWDNNTYYSENVRVKNGGKFYEVKAGQSVAPGDPEPGGLFSNWQEKWTDQIDAGWEPVPSKTGISVDGIFTNDKGESYTQPGFYYLDYDRERVNH